MLRKGDSLKLSAESAVETGDVAWSIDGTASSADASIAFTQAFAEAGDKTITATFGGVTKTLTVKVVDFDLPKNADGTDWTPAAMLTQTRNFTLPGLPTDFVVEADENTRLSA